MIQDTVMNADFHNGPNLGLEPTTPRQVRGADVAQPKRRPYNASGSLSEYGVFPECDAAPAAQSPAKGADVALPHPLGIVDPDPTAPRVYTVQDLANYAREAVLADRQQRGGDALDAARYRWLRKGESDAVAVVRGLGSMDYGGSAVVYTHSEEIDGDDLDAVIDAAMRKEMSNG